MTHRLFVRAGDFFNSLAPHSRPWGWRNPFIKTIKSYIDPVNTYILQKQLNESQSCDYPAIWLPSSFLTIPFQTHLCWNDLCNWLCSCCVTSALISLCCYVCSYVCVKEGTMGTWMKLMTWSFGGFCRIFLGPSDLCLSPWHNVKIWFWLLLRR